ncbi:MAG: hypothetical protein QG597_2516, partial [Actinomycetota bacterium]|nr:hypothetical protein [Actinomycetota bacterium]
MTEDLMTIVLDRANADDELPEEAKLLVLAAMEGDADLAQALDADAPTPSSRCADVRSDERAATSPARAYLSAISVEGFRGVGPAATLRLRPGPGLVVIAGRNGCGKSSFAEAVEVAFTRGSYRWRHRPQYWRESWRNLDQKTTAS